MYTELYFECCLDVNMHFDVVNLTVFFLSRPTSGRVVTLETGRREVPGSNPGRACRPRRSEFSAVFSETRVNTG